MNKKVKNPKHLKLQLLKRKSRETGLEILTAASSVKATEGLIYSYLQEIYLIFRSGP